MVAWDIFLGCYWIVRVITQHKTWLKLLNTVSLNRSPGLSVAGAGLEFSQKTTCAISNTCLILGSLRKLTYRVSSRHSDG